MISCDTRSLTSEYRGNIMVLPKLCTDSSLAAIILPAALWSKHKKTETYQTSTHYHLQRSKICFHLGQRLKSLIMQIFPGMQPCFVAYDGCKWAYLHQTVTYVSAPPRLQLFFYIDSPRVTCSEADGPPLWSDG